MELIILPILKTIGPYLLAAFGFFAWKLRHDRKIISESKQKDRLRQQEALSRALAIDRPTSSELRNSLQTGTF